MEQQQAPIIDSALAAQMESAGETPLPVHVTFRGPMKPAVLEPLGLRLAAPGESALAFGLLQASGIRALAKRADVVRIARAAALPQSRQAPNKAADKIEESLRRRMERDKGVSHHVLVSFVKPLDDDDVEELGLMPGSATEASGQLTTAEIRALSERSEVKRIRSSPEMKPLGTK